MKINFEFRPGFMGLRNEFVEDKIYIEDVDQREHELLIRRKRLYHGSPHPDINTPFRIAEDTTVGEGLYCTSSIDTAWGYATHRFDARNTSEAPRVYEFEIQNKRFIDLRRQSEINRILPKYRKVLIDTLQEEIKKTDNYFRIPSITRLLENMLIKKITPGTLRDIAKTEPQLFTSFLQGEGYEGLVCFEGGEGDIGFHDTWLLFDPTSANVTQEFSMTE
jgi:hypothetical protein